MNGVDNLSKFFTRHLVSNRTILHICDFTRKLYIYRRYTQRYAYIQKVGPQRRNPSVQTNEDLTRRPIAKEEEKKYSNRAAINVRCVISISV